jgi:hypothetical protein
MLKRLCICLMVLTLSLAACGDEEPAPPANESGSQVLTGVVVAIDGQGLEDVDGFTLRVDGANYDFWIDGEREYGFALGHLHAHLQGAEPVRVTYEEKGGRLVALAIEDA